MSGKVVVKDEKKKTYIFIIIYFVGGWERNLMENVDAGILIAKLYIIN
jgi:hypothetical protein